MPKNTGGPSKPRSQQLRPELTSLPELTPERLAFRRRMARLFSFVIRLLTRPTVRGLENFPASGPGLITINHLGDADVALLMAALPIQPDGLAKVELYDFPIVGWILERYGVIWVHRGTADRRALRAALDGLAQGRFIGIAPEGRFSQTGALETATGGAAYLARKSGAPIIPIALTGTSNEAVYGSWRRLRRPALTLTVGNPFHLEDAADRKDGLQDSADRIMRRLAVMLPEAYRGVYAD